MTRFRISPLTRFEISGWLVLALLLWLLFTNHEAVAAAPRVAFFSPATGQVTATGQPVAEAFSLAEAGMATASADAAWFSRPAAPTHFSTGAQRPGERRGLSRFAELFHRGRPARHQPLGCPAYSQNELRGRSGARHHAARAQKRRAGGPLAWQRLFRQ